MQAKEMCDCECRKELLVEVGFKVYTHQYCSMITIVKIGKFGVYRDYMNDTPGIDLVTLLKRAPRHELADLIPTPSLKLLEFVDPSFIDSDQFAEALDHLIEEPLDILGHPDKREQVINLLPIHKAHELADRLSIQKGKNLYRDLRNTCFKPKARETLEAFLGKRRLNKSRWNISLKRTVCPTYGLYAHQRQAVFRVESLLAAAPYKALLHLPTGSGKTRTSMHIVANHLRTNKSTIVCWLAYSAELLEQAASELERAWESLGDRPIEIVRFWGRTSVNIMEITDGVVVAGLNKICAFDQQSPNFIPTFADRTSLIIIDEAHQSIAPTYRSMLDALYTKRPTNALLGLTATPGRTWSDIEEDRKLAEYFGQQKVSLEIDGYTDPICYLIDEGYLARPKFHRLEGRSTCSFTEHDRASSRRSMDFSKGVLDKLGNDVNRNSVILSKIKELAKRHHRTLVFAPSVPSAIAIGAVLRVQGVLATEVTGKTPQDKREFIIRQFRSAGGPPRVLINYGVLTTGFDAPSTSAALIARQRIDTLVTQTFSSSAMMRKTFSELFNQVSLLQTALPALQVLRKLPMSSKRSVYHKIKQTRLSGSV